jgi:hypothetical protein
VYNNARVSGDAKVFGNATVSNHEELSSGIYLTREQVEWALGRKDQRTTVADPADAALPPLTDFQNSVITTDPTAVGGPNEALNQVRIALPGRGMQRK